MPLSTTTMLFLVLWPIPIQMASHQTGPLLTTLHLRPITPTTLSLPMGMILALPRGLHRLDLEILPWLLRQPLPGRDLPISTPLALEPATH